MCCRTDWVARRRGPGTSRRLWGSTHRCARRSKGCARRRNAWVSARGCSKRRRGCSVPGDTSWTSRLHPASPPHPSRITPPSVTTGCETEPNALQVGEIGCADHLGYGKMGSDVPVSRWACDAGKLVLQDGDGGRPGDHGLLPGRYLSAAWSTRVRLRYSLGPSGTPAAHGGVRAGGRTGWPGSRIPRTR